MTRLARPMGRRAIVCKFLLFGCPEDISAISVQLEARTAMVALQTRPGSSMRASLSQHMVIRSCFDSLLRVHLVIKTILSV